MSETEVGPIVKPSFFEEATDVLARRLLGMALVHETTEGTTAGLIVEVEMYRGPHDKGAHSYGGRRTIRTEVMYGPPGHAYVYFIYGMYYCFNVVAGARDQPEAILIRALKPMTGMDLMARRRGLKEIPQTARQRSRLLSGPGRLAQGMAITKEQYGLPLWKPPLYIAEPAHSGRVAFEVASGPRINIGYAEEAKDYPWRFWIQGDASVSVP